MRVERLARERGVALEWNAFLLGPIFQSQGWNDSPFNLYETKGRYMWRDLERICDAEGLPFARPSRFPRSGLLAARVACRGAREPWLPAFVRAVYDANFAARRGDLGARGGGRLPRAGRAGAGAAPRGCGQRRGEGRAARPHRRGAPARDLRGAELPGRR